MQLVRRKKIAAPGSDTESGRKEMVTTKTMSLTKQGWMGTGTRPGALGPVRACPWEHAWKKQRVLLEPGQNLEMAEPDWLHSSLVELIA